MFQVPNADCRTAWATPALAISPNYSQTALNMRWTDYQQDCTHVHIHGMDKINQYIFTLLYFKRLTIIVPLSPSPHSIEQKISN